MHMEASKRKWISYIQFALHAVILIMLAFLLGYIYIQDDRLKELEKRMAAMSMKVEGNRLVVIKAVQTMLKRSEELEAIDSRLGVVEKRSEELEAIDSRLGVVENNVNELFMQNEEFVSIKDKTSQQLERIESESQIMEQDFGKMEDNLEKILEELENTDQMLQQLNDSMADICNRHKSALSSQPTLQAQLDEIQSDDKAFNQRESDQKHNTKKTVEMMSVQSSAINNLEETRKDVQELIRSREDVLDEHSNAIEKQKENIQDVRQHIAASQSCLSGIVALDQPVPSYEERLLRVQFGIPFSSPPVISYGIVKLDTSAQSNSRIGVSLLDQSATGFTVSFTTWSGNIVYDCSISWMACART